MTTTVSTNQAQGSHPANPVYVTTAWPDNGPGLALFTPLFPIAIWLLGDEWKARRPPKPKKLPSWYDPQAEEQLRRAGLL
jgi:hypothetical protein